MGDPLSVAKSDSTSIEGLEAVFVEQVSTGQDTYTELDSPAQDTIQGQYNPGQRDVQAWTVEEAASQLGVSSKTILRRLQKGTLKGFKVPGQFGLEWRVAQDSPSQPTAPAMDKTPQDTVEIIQLRTKVELMSSELKELKQQLQGASYRNGYLEAQSEAFQNQIKLLTDSQHRKGWWARFSSWFMTSR